MFAVKVAGADVDATDVATMDADRIARLKAVFGDMTAIATEVETINHPGSGDRDGWTERNLYITITAKTAEEMKTVYHFNRNQIAALDELLEQRDLLRELIEDVYSVSGDTAALLRNLPEGLSLEREAVVRTACSLVGKVNYFWGGKSLVIGWDAAGASCGRSLRQAAPPPVPIGPTDWIAAALWIGFSSISLAAAMSSATAVEPPCSTAIAPIFRGRTHSPVTWCSTRIIPMWASLAAGTQTENCLLSTAPADITMWSLPARRALPLSVDHNTMASS